MNTIQTYTFWQLTNQYKIEIPIVQRDYAQGRTDQKSKEVRDKFLCDLLACLGNNKSIELDFIYGKVKDDIFIPIDGQQRLSTLFLLHWYIAQRANAKSEFTKIYFTYETRVSARDFCNALKEKPINFEELLNPDDKKANALSKTIENESWFFLSWKKDPTVQAMLNMLDAIHKEFKEENFGSMWDKLTESNYVLPKDNPKLNNLIVKIDSDSNKSSDVKIALAEVKKEPAISFKFLNLEDFKLTDELYLKMNARGKALSDFENFKAWLIEHVGKLLEGDSMEIKTFKEKWCNNDDGKDWHSLMDKTWTDWIWDTNNNSIDYKGDNLFDNAGINFIKNIAFINYFINSIRNESNEDKVSTEYLSKKENNIFLEKVYNECFKTTDNCKLLFDAFNILSQKKLFSEAENVLWDIDKKEFKKNIFLSSTFKEKSYLYAIVQFYSENINRPNFADWFRVIRNLIENTDINATNFKNILDSIIFLSKQTLKECKEEIKGFKEDQIKEEVIKIKLIEKNKNWEPQIIEVENHPLFKGNIGFLLPDKEKTDLKIFEDWKNVTMLLFEEEGDNVDKGNYLLIRSVLSKCKNEDVKFPLCLINNRNNWRKLLNEEFFQKGLILILDAMKDSICYKDTLTKICDDYNTDTLWQFTLVTHPFLLSKYSETRLVKKYWDDIYKKTYIFLFEKINFMYAGNMLIENNRNSIVSSFLKMQFNLKDEGRKIKMSDDLYFFKGWKIELSKKVQNQTLNLVFERDRVTVTDNNGKPIDYFFDDEKTLLERLKKNFGMYFISQQ